MTQKTRYEVNFEGLHFEHEVGTHYIWVREVGKGPDSEAIDCMSFQWEKNQTELTRPEFLSRVLRYNAELLK